MADFELEVDSPFPKPQAELLHKKPMRLEYSDNRIKYKHYGKNIELLVQKALELEDEKEREAAVIYIGKLMKSFYNTWNRDNIEDELILKNIKALSKGELHIDIDKVKKNNLFETLYRDKRKGKRRSGGKRRRN